ncbi:TadE/TadG family type IV pilus assembly protein [Ralstonia syzygii subsp. celebesensis]|uniref:Pilus assembly protein TadE n=2 Tax=Ralstonia syzygii subsp. celebesensis TaxID=1310168 RepID=A0A1U9VIF0_9RALS|nr:TadE/TadG family type IV pilus assembly protein [Ralstonia syzygii]AQW30472.1 pilus assembly protein TadE [blood disease bacterium A2-HR MARDI]QQV55698.1 pilus assembly protein [Ralstonia syzygii subsp. celebesensis]CCA81057.1 putative pilus related protein, TadE-like [blood disease bacterium R229]
MRSRATHRTAHRPARAHKMRGAAGVEFALVFPILLLVVFGIVEFGAAWYDKSVITNASREAARSGVVFSSPVPTSTKIQSVATNYCQNKLVTFGAAANCTVSPVTTCSATGNPLTVTVSYTFTGLVLGKLAPFTGSLALSAQTTMLCE